MLVSLALPSLVQETDCNGGRPRSDQWKVDIWGNTQWNPSRCFTQLGIFESKYFAGLARQAEVEKERREEAKKHEDKMVPTEWQAELQDKRLVCSIGRKGGVNEILELFAR